MIVLVLVVVLVLVLEIELGLVSVRVMVSVMSYEHIINQVPRVGVPRVLWVPA